MCGKFGFFHSWICQDENFTDSVYVCSSRRRTGESYSGRKVDVGFFAVAVGKEGINSVYVFLAGYMSDQ